MNISVHIRQLLALIVIVLMCACNETDELPTQQMGRVEVRLVAPYRAATRATGDWLDPVDSKEKIHQWWVAFVNSSNIVQELVSGDAEGKEQDVFTFLLPPGTYTVYGFANLDNFNALGITKGAALPDLSKKTLATTNGWTENIPMSSHSGGQTVKVQEAENQSFQVELIRAMAKLELNFINKYQQQMDILGYKITPLTKTSVSLLEPTTPSAIVTADDNIEAHEVDLQSAPLVLAKDNGTATSYVYVNETNATATSTVNQYSIQLKVQRHQTVGGSDMTHEVEYRYGFTMNSSTVVDGVAGFDYIRRNDWIRLPIVFSDYTFRVEALPFPPIAGFQSRVETADALSITFQTGGYIALRPMFRSNTDPDGVWHSFDDSDVVFKLGEEYTENATTGAMENIDDDSGTGLVLTGDLDIFQNYFVLYPSGEIVGYLSNGATGGQVTVTLKVQIGGFYYQFNYNIILHNS